MVFVFHNGTVNLGFSNSLRGGCRLGTGRRQSGIRAA